MARRDATSALKLVGDINALNRGVRRLKEIVGELKDVIQFLEDTPELGGSQALDIRVHEELERVRVPGFCGYRLALEAASLIELTAARIAALRLSGARADPSIDAAERLIDQMEPAIRETAADLAVYASLDGRQQLEAKAKRLNDRNTK